MNRVVHVLLVASLLPGAPCAQAEPPPIAYRDFASVQRLRVVCQKQHFGRVVDLIAELPSGKLTAAIVAMATDGGTQTVAVPFHCLRYDAQSNLLQLGPCLDEDETYPTFDPAQIKATPARDVDGKPTGEVAGTVSVARLVQSAVALDGGGPGATHGATIELGTGNVAFVEVASTKRPAGDNQLHPVPWAAFRLSVGAEERDGGALALALPMNTAQLDATPTLIEVIVQDPLYRTRAYEAFGVPRPAYDRL